MTEKQQYIVGIVMDDNTLRKIAWLKWTSLRAIREEIFITLADHMVVHSELGLDYDWHNSMIRLKEAMVENHINHNEYYNLMSITLNNVQLKAKAVGDGSVSLILNQRSVNLHFSAKSIVKLIRFIDEVIPEIDLMVKEKALEIERDELALSIAGGAIRCKMDELGLKYHVFETEHVLEIDILLPPDGRLHFTVKEEEVQDAINHLKATVAAAIQLYANHGINICFRPLERWDRWAEPYNRNV